MKRADTQQLIRSWWSAFNEKDLDRFASYLAEDLNVENLYGMRLDSRAEFEDYLQPLFAMSTDARIAVEHTIVEGEHAAAELHMRATHDGASVYGVEPSGKAIELRWTIHVELAESKVKRIKIFSNPLTILEQLGLSEGLPSIRP